ncbi:YdbL family protein [Desulfomicrobium escambiense]|uniref:YdbL family protein n=1 Tax=Desulfomicrobium escambiense TaxID=29503 RepID=UPI0004146A09|nr:YdbL family protein [Desulfomicrobium escambiense]
MRTPKFLIATILAALAVLLLAQAGLADDIKDRMKARLPVITELKAQGLLGENNKGFLEFRGGQKPNADVVQAENADRAAVYKAIAQRQKTTPDFVGQARAAQIAEKEPAGFWVQDPGGAWKKK